MARRKKKPTATRSEDDGGGGGSSDGKKGFGVVTESSSSSSSAPCPSDNIYSMPPLYDLAFGYRSYEDEVSFLLDAHDEYSHSSAENDDRRPLRILELAAGPARHSLAALSIKPPSEVESATALDRSGAMVRYGLENADVELGAPGGRRDDFAYLEGDMRNVGDSLRASSSSSSAAVSAASFDTAWLLLGSMTHLLANDEIISCLSSVRSVLEPGGTVVVELPHPRETFSMGECTRNGWTVPLVEDTEDGEEKEYGELNIVWGDEGDEFDPVAQVRQFTVGLELTVNDVEDIPKDADTSPLFLQMSEEGKTKVREIVPMRLFTLQEIDLLARCAGFEMVAKYGALVEDVSIEDEEEAFRMVCVLRKS